MLFTGAVIVIFFVGLIASLQGAEDFEDEIPEKMAPALKVLLRALFSILSLAFSV
jgi:hypothetical protein